MKHVRLGNTGLKVSRIFLGCGNFGGVGSAPEFFGMGESEREAHELLDAAVDLGVTVLDTANAYGGGRSEAYIGSWLKKKGTAQRHRMVLSSKVFNPVGDGPNDRGLSRMHIFQQVEESLNRLGVEALDLYLIHEPDPYTPIKETLRALDDLIQQGKIRYIGASNMPIWLMAKALWASDKLHLARFEWVQNAYSLLARDDEKEMFPLVADQRLGYTPFSPLSGGLLTGKYDLEGDYPEGSRMTMRPEPYMKLWNQQTFDGLRRLRREADDRGVSMAGLALAWVMGHPLVTAPIVGPRRMSHFKPVREALSLELSAEEREQISAYFEDAQRMD